MILLKFLTNNSFEQVLRQQLFKNTFIKSIFYSTMSANGSPSQSEERKAFLDTLNVVLETIESSEKFTEIPEMASWIKKVLKYNLDGGKKTRGRTTVLSYQMLEKPENLTDETLKLARILGWCVEMLQSFFVIADDIMDSSTTRRGVPCWYRVPDVGLGAINDAILIYNSIFEVLQVHFRKLPQYTDIVDLFNETVLYSSSGQHLDLVTSNRSKNDYSCFTMEKYESIIKYKTAYYTYRLPVSLGMLLANITDPATREKADIICLDIGKFFQIQDDFIDCFSDESVTGKAGTDIQEGKCCWLSVIALQRCSPAQRKIFDQYYGSKNPEHVKRIKQLYEKLDLPHIYREQESARYKDIIKKAIELSRDTQLSSSLFVKLIDMIYNRRK